MDTYFRDALQAYAAVPYKDLHAYLERRFHAWYAKFKPASSEVVDVEDAEVGAVVSVEGVDGEARPAKKTRFSPPTPTAGGGTSGDDAASGERTGTASPLLILPTMTSGPREAIPET